MGRECNCPTENTGQSSDLSEEGVENPSPKSKHVFL